MTLQAGGVWVIVYECNTMEVLLNKQSTSNTISILKSKTNKYSRCAFVEAWSNFQRSSCVTSNASTKAAWRCLSIALECNQFKVAERKLDVPTQAIYIHSNVLRVLFFKRAIAELKTKSRDEKNHWRRDYFQLVISSSWKCEGDHTKSLLRGYQQPWTLNNQHKNSQRVPHFGTQLSSCSAAYESVCLAARIAAMHLWRCLPHDGLSMFQTLCTTPSDQSRIFQSSSLAYTDLNWWRDSIHCGNGW